MRRDFTSGGHAISFTVWRIRHASVGGSRRVQMSGRICDDPFACGAIGIVSLVTMDKGHDLASLALRCECLSSSQGVAALESARDNSLFVFVDVQALGSAELVPSARNFPSASNMKAGVSAIADRTRARVSRRREHARF